MNSSSHQKITFSSFKKEEAVPPRSSPGSEIRPGSLNRLVKIGFKSLVALNLGLCAYVFLTEPPKRRRDIDSTMVNDATRSEPEMFLCKSFKEDLEIPCDMKT